MSTKSAKNIAILREKYQQDVDLLLEDFFCYSDNDDFSEDCFNVDIVLKTKLPKKLPQKVNHKSNATHHVKHKNATQHTFRRIDAQLNVIDPFVYEERTISRKDSILKKIFWFQY